MNNLKLTFRHAKKEDISFIIEGFIEAEKGGSNLVPTQKIFDLSLKDLEEALYNFFNDPEIIDCELSLKSYHIAELNNYPIASICLWVEGINGLSSNAIRMTSWFQFLGKAKFDTIKNNIELVKKYALTRFEDYLQCEYLYVSTQYRKSGILKRLLKESLYNYSQNLQSIKGLQTMLFKENVPSYNFFNSRGFNTNEEVTIGPDALGIYFGHRTRLSMILDIHKLDEFLNSL